MMLMRSSSSVNNQLYDSIDKLMHYLAVYVKRDTTVTVHLDANNTYEREFRASRQVIISPTLYTRLDDCHGAGNCCRVPFDLVYTDYDRQRIEEYDHSDAVQVFGRESAEGFQRYRDQLLERLTPLEFRFSQVNYHHTGRIWVQRNTEINLMSGNKSCPYLVMGDDRYFCGAHPFKPLHCWYPHMTVRVTESRDGSTVSVGRMQYGRNHKFGCPVKFTEVDQHDDGALFAELQVGGKPNYFDQQFQDDINKLEWTSRSAESLGFSERDNFVVGIHEQLRRTELTMRSLLRTGKPSPIPLWRNDVT